VRGTLVGVVVGVLITVLGVVATDIMKATYFFGPNVEWGEEYSFDLNPELSINGNFLAVTSIQIANRGWKSSSDIRIVLDRAPLSLQTSPTFPVSLDASDNSFAVLNVPGLASSEEISVRLIGAYQPRVLRVTAGDEIADKVILRSAPLSFGSISLPLWLVLGVPWLLLILIPLALSSTRTRVEGEPPGEAKKNEVSPQERGEKR
jgi:hypothetical protein